MTPANPTKLINGFFTDNIGHPADTEHGGGNGQKISQNHPLHHGKLAIQRTNQGRQGHIDNTAVHGGQEHAGTNSGHGMPFAPKVNFCWMFHFACSLISPICTIISHPLITEKIRNLTQPLKIFLILEVKESFGSCTKCVNDSTKSPGHKYPVCLFLAEQLTDQ